MQHALRVIDDVVDETVTHDARRLLERFDDCLELALVSFYRNNADQIRYGYDAAVALRRRWRPCLVLLQSQSHDRLLIGVEDSQRS